MSDQPSPPPIEPYRGSEPLEALLRKKAIERIEERRAFQWHLASYVVVNAALVLIWLLTGGDYFWPIWPMLGWGVGLAFHAIAYVKGEITEDEIGAEVERLRGTIKPPGPQDTI